MMSIPKLLIFGGLIMIIGGIVWAVGGKLFNLGRLPGDVVVEKGNVKFYFPIVTCIILSGILTLGMYIFRYFSK